MKPDLSTIDDVIKQNLPSASPLHVEAAAIRVSQRLRAASEQTIEEALEASPVHVAAGPAWWQMAAAAALVIAAVTGATLWKASTSHVAVVAGVDASLSSDVNGRFESLAQGTTVDSDQPVRTTGEAGAVLTLADGSSVEMRSQSELAVERAVDGLDVHLHRGSVIVHAAKQRQGHLYVTTKDVRVSVVGTVFLVKAEDDGSRVGVIEGEVHVREGAVETSLRPGQQVTTNRAAAAQPLRDEIAWSRNAPGLISILDSFTRGMAISAGRLEPVAKTPGATQGAGLAAAPQFEEASVRPCDPDNIPEPPAGARGGGANSFQMTPGRLHALCMTLATLIRTAYGYGPAQLAFLQANAGRGRGLGMNNIYGLGVEDGLRVRGGPDWVRSDRYTIDAVAGDTADPVAMSQPMLRSLLEKRFQLKTHIETEQVPAFALTVAPGGLKIKPVGDGSCERQPPIPSGQPVRSGPDGIFVGNPPVLLFRPASFAEVRRGAKPQCGAQIVPNGPNAVVVAGGATIEGVGRALGGRLGGVQVFDRTGTTDTFNFVLEFLVDKDTPGNGIVNIPVPQPPAPVQPGQNIYVALRDQLGLQLEPAKAPREFLVIEHVERPTAN
jgi:uncharacterized protein (TIGR03435 family)